MTRIESTAQRITPSCLPLSVQFAASPLCPKKVRPKPRELELWTGISILSASNARTAAMSWTLVSRVPSVGQYGIMFSATSATDEDKANQSPREKIRIVEEGLFGGEKTTYLINL